MRSRQTASPARGRSSTLTTEGLFAAQHEGTADPALRQMRYGDHVPQRAVRHAGYERYSEQLHLANTAITSFMLCAFFRSA